MRSRAGRWGSLKAPCHDWRVNVLSKTSTRAWWKSSRRGSRRRRPSRSPGPCRWRLLATVGADDGVGRAGSGHASGSTRRSCRPRSRTGSALRPDPILRHREPGAAVEHGAGRGARHGRRQRPLRAEAIVERRGGRPVVGDPPGRRRAVDDAPRVDQVRVDEVGRDRSIGDQVVRRVRIGRVAVVRRRRHRAGQEQQRGAAKGEGSTFRHSRYLLRRTRRRRWSTEMGRRIRHLCYVGVGGPGFGHAPRSRRRGLRGDRTRSAAAYPGTTASPARCAAPGGGAAAALPAAVSGPCGGRSRLRAAAIASAGYPAV